MSNQNDKWQMTRHDKATRALIKKKKNLISQLQGSCGKRYLKFDGAFGIWQHCFFFPPLRQIFRAKHFSAFRYPFDVFFFIRWVTFCVATLQRKFFKKYFCAHALAFLTYFFHKGLLVSHVWNIQTKVGMLIILFSDQTVHHTGASNNKY